VAHAYNPSYSGSRDQEDCDLKPAWQIVLETLSQKNPPQKRTGGVGQGVGPEFKPQYCQKKKKGCQSGSSGRASAKKVKGAEFKPSTEKKKSSQILLNIMVECVPQKFM
jgi:hypothetical protein